MINNNSSDENQNSQVLLNQLVMEYLRAKKQKNRWRWVMRIIVTLFTLWVFYLILSIRSDDLGISTSAHVGLIDIKGSIFDGQSGSADNFIKGMSKAYDNKAMKAVILRIDSPGGSPVQADYMFNAVRYYRKQYPNIKVYAVCVDACTSAAYYVASAADEIYANPASLVGSIGVLYNGFGFVDAMHKLGVSRRLLTAGQNKGFLDQFSPVEPAQEKNMRVMLDLIHKQFINKVKEGRGNRLHIDEETFSGLFWTGEQAKSRGLIDGFASSGQLTREVIKINDVVDYTYKQSMMERVAKNIGASLASQLPTALGMRPGFQ